MPRAKISLTLDAAVVDVVDRVVSESPGLNRSRVIERILRQWMRQQRKRALDEQVEQYYTARSAEEVEEDDEWARFAAESFGTTWNDE